MGKHQVGWEAERARGRAQARVLIVVSVGRMDEVGLARSGLAINYKFRGL